MLKLILKLSIAAFFILFTYDTINVFLYLDKTNKKENQLVVVHREIDLSNKEEAVIFGDKSQKAEKQPWLLYGIGGVLVSLIIVLYFVKFKRRERQIVCKSNEINDVVILNNDTENNIDASVCSVLSLENINNPEEAKEDNSTNSEQSSQSRVSVSFEQTNSSRNLADEIKRSSIEENQLDNTPTKDVDTKEREICYDEVEKPFEDSNVLQSSRIFLDSEISYRDSASSPHDVTLITVPEQIVATMSCCNSGMFRNKLSDAYEDKFNSEIEELYDKIESEKTNIEKRFGNLEKHINQWKEHLERRMDVVNAELVELHEQMYTVLTKLEEHQKPNYVIVSQIPKEAPVTEEAESETFINEIRSNRPKSAISQQGEPKEGKHVERDLCQVTKKIYLNRGDNTSSSAEELNSFNETLKSKSVGLEAILEKEIPSRNATAPPKKANPKKLLKTDDLEYTNYNLNDWPMFVRIEERTLSEKNAVKELAEIMKERKKKKNKKLPNLTVRP